MQRQKWMKEKINNHEDEGKEFGGFKDAGVPVMWDHALTAICFPRILFLVQVALHPIILLNPFPSTSYSTYLNYIFITCYHSHIPKH